MADSLNRTQLLGRVHSDPKTKVLDSGSTLLQFVVETWHEFRNRKTGEYESRTQRNRVVVWGRRAERNRRLAMGHRVYIEGRLETRSYEQDGQTKWVTEVNAFELINLSHADDGPEPYHQGAQQPPPSNNESQLPDEDDDLPF
jgi:single-strand DNA-binding protein